MDDIPALGSLDRRFLNVLRWRGAIKALILLAVAAIGELVLADQRLPNGLAAVPALAFGAWLTFVAPARKFTHWGFALDDRELQVAHGWLMRVHTVVPIGRVQHIDLSQGPIERACGVATVVLHTAGTDHSRVAVPGLSREAAEEVRDRIRAAIGASP
ncbi:PH domain-containing protein [uncultured Sphingomonas sp.]|uniref:PH domain-containing protein n=1 Tax=uncultured Sphingomonas sp. TaxID=158754 RepID=UPI0025E53848|nr:PH domain-containing protein [uncultured Sphingomonas sp.]